MKDKLTAFFKDERAAININWATVLLAMVIFSFLSQSGPELIKAWRSNDCSDTTAVIRK